MTDICERLRAEGRKRESELADLLCNDAADEIDRLRAQVAEGRELLAGLQETYAVVLSPQMCTCIDAYLAKTARMKIYD